MSKKQLKNLPKGVRVMALPGRVIKNAKGEVVKQLYNIFKLN
jgi:hypothetical protein